MKLLIVLALAVFSILPILPASALQCTSTSDEANAQSSLSSTSAGGILDCGHGL